VNGVEVPLYRTNYAFSGVKIDGSGEKDVEVFVDLSAVKYALAISIVAVIALIWSAVYVVRNRAKN
jgi:hypothetical protein